MSSGRPSIPVTEGLYGVTAFLIVIALVLQLLPSGGQLEAGVAVSPDSSSLPAGAVQSPETLSPLDSGSGLTDMVAEPLPETYQPIVALNIFSPERKPPRRRYVLKEKEGEHADRLPQLSVRQPPRGPRLFGVTLRESGASALIEADPRVPGAEIYRVGDPIAGGRVIEIGPSSVIIQRTGGGRQVIRLEAARSESAPPANLPIDSLSTRQNEER